jgi:hypothetical protein
VFHICRCRLVYECPFCGGPNSWICPTVNSDEDANMCPSCLDRVADEYAQAWHAEETGD